MKQYRLVDAFHYVSRRAFDLRKNAGKDDSSDDNTTISDDTYNRIPDKYKNQKSPEYNESKDENNKKNSGRSQPQQDPDGGSSRRGPWAGLIFVLALSGVLIFGYRAFFSAKSTELTWTAFNRLLDEGMISSATQHGASLVGELRAVPPLADWIDSIPDGRNQFRSAVEQYDRSRPNKAKALNEELDAYCEKAEFHVEKPATPSKDEKILLSLVDKETKEVYLSAEERGDASDARIKAVQRDLLEDLRLRYAVEQRWDLEPLSAGRLRLRNAMQMVDKETRKAFGKVFFQRYTCEPPAFAFADPTLDEKLRDKLDSYSSIPQRDNSWWFTALSIGVTLLFFLLIFRTIRAARDPFSFGQSNSLAKKYDPESGKGATFADVAGMDQVKAELVEVVDFLKNPSKYERMGARVPRGTLLFGPPGTGKTLLARAVAGEAGVPFFSINGSEFIQMFVGVGASRVRDLFAKARENSPSILFIDEIDAVGRQRGAGVGGGQDEREQTLNQILSEMDGFSQGDSIMVIASTNRPDVLDPALMRPGRFDRHITVGRPSMKGRVDIFKVYLKKIPYASDVDVDKLAKLTAGFTGADIRNFVNEATLWATRNDKTKVEASDFDFAFEKIALGLKRDEIIKPADKRKTACHEAGHAVVGWFLPNGSKVHKVTIIPRGRALGVTWSLPEEDKVSYDAGEARASLAHLLAGRAAEALVYNVTTSGVENDLQRATDLARDMVARWGMSEKLGPVAFPNSENHPFLGREMTIDSRAYSEATAQIIDEEIKRIIREADETARQILTEKRDLFDALVEALVEEEEVDRKRLVEILGPAPGDENDSLDETTFAKDAPQEENEDSAPDDAPASTPFAVEPPQDDQDPFGQATSVRPE